MSSAASTAMSPLEVFYSNSTVLISGGNGFLGKVLIEKLLRCFDIAKIYLLMRAKNGEDVEGRMKKFLNETVSDDDNFRHDLQFARLFCARLTDLRLFKREKSGCAEKDYSH